MSAPFLEVLGRTSLSAAAMILAVLALRTRFRQRTSQRVFCLLWDLVLLRLLVPAELPSPLSIRRLLAGLAPRAEMVAAYETGISRPLVVDSWTFSQETAAVRYCFFSPGGAGLDWSALLSALWLAGALLGGLWLLWGHLRSRRLYSASLPVRDAAVADWQARHPLRRPVQVRRSDRIVSPLTYGVLYPVVLLPAGLDLTDGEVLSCVLTHEYTHIRRFDTLRKGLLALALCLHWFNPLVWAMHVLANRDIELACDEAVVRAGADRRGYALALLRLEEERGFLSGSSFSRNALEERIEAIMKMKKFSLTAVIAILVAMSIATTVFATSAPEEDTGPVTPGSSPQVTLAESTDDCIQKGVMSTLDENGSTLYSVDGGKTWMSEDRFHAEYDSGWDVEWWTAGDYAAWLEQEKKELQEMIGERGYNPTDGWFTWDQQRVDEAIALYESILEDIKKGALYSKTIVDKDGHVLDDVALGSDGLLIAQSFDSAGMVEVKPDQLERQREDLFQECAPFGLTGSEKDGLFYNGQRVRAFVDGYAVANNGYAVHYAYYDESGTVDLHTIRAYVRYADGSYDPAGDLTALVAAGDANFDQGLIDCALPSAGGQTASAEGSGLVGSGRTLEEIFARYEPYGLACQPGENGFVSLTYNGQPVRRFADLGPDGSTFTYENPYTDEGIELRTVYDENGNLTGLRPETAAA